MDTYRSKIVGLKQKLIPTQSYLVVKSVLSELPTNLVLRTWKEIKSRIFCQQNVVQSQLDIKHQRRSLAVENR
jgi:hypothetical protein